MLLLIRSFLAVVEEGSLHKAAARLHMSQSALSRQMQALEHELGGRLLERSTTGVKPTNGGHALVKKMTKFLAGYDSAMLDVRRIVRGNDSSELRIGYFASAFKEYLDPALRIVRRKHPDLRVKLLDLFPAEQIAALRAGETDVAMTQHGDNLLGKEFYCRKLAEVGSLAALPGCHPLAKRKKLRLAELKDETFLGGAEEHVPGARRHLLQICKECAGFRPRMVNIAGDLSDAFSHVANDDAIGLLPGFMKHLHPPGVALVPVADEGATWNIHLAWQRGPIPEALRTLLDALFEKKK